MGGRETIYFSMSSQKRALEACYNGCFDWRGATGFAKFDGAVGGCSGIGQERVGGRQ